MAKEAIFLIGKNTVEVPRGLESKGDKHFLGIFSHHRNSLRSKFLRASN